MGMNRVWHSGPFKGCPHSRPISGLQFPAGRGLCLGRLQPGEGLAWSAVLGPPPTPVSAVCWKSSQTSSPSTFCLLRFVKRLCPIPRVLSSWRPDQTLGPRFAEHSPDQDRDLTWDALQRSSSGTPELGCFPVPRIRDLPWGKEGSLLPPPLTRCRHKQTVRWLLRVPSGEGAQRYCQSSERPRPRPCS